MKTNIRQEERKKAQAVLEQKAIDKVLNSINKHNIKPDILKRKPIEHFIFSKKYALYTSLLEDQNKWISKHRYFYRDYTP